MVLHVPSVKKQADDAKRLAKLLLRIETNLEAREAKPTGKARPWITGPGPKYYSLVYAGLPFFGSRGNARTTENVATSRNAMVVIGISEPN